MIPRGDSACSTTALTVIDSHTAGEPTRVVIEGFPGLGQGPLHERRERMREQYDAWRTAIVCEPRGSDVLVGAVLQAPVDPEACAGVIFFNNVGYLGMCGHGTIGVIRTLQHLGRIRTGRHRLETPVGTVEVELCASGEVAVDNVESYRHLKDVAVEVPGHGLVRGDVAWGGNWFFITGQAPVALEPARSGDLTVYAEAVRRALERNGVTGAGGAAIDHVEISGCAPHDAARARNFVLCPGLAYDRSPCGTGTSAKLACLAADGELQPGEVWRQEGILGTVFEASYRSGSRGVLPRICGRAYITAESRLLIDARDPFAWGIGPP
ncbi:MAG TPA: proline racemase family protein [Steroidobacteraceae bacterium]|nr:proline racemase family protein [Steroidobacteraceae bacterium]